MYTTDGHFIIKGTYEVKVPMDQKVYDILVQAAYNEGYDDLEVHLQERITKNIKEAIVIITHVAKHLSELTDEPDTYLISKEHLQ